MRVKLLVCLVGPKFAGNPGDEYVCGDAEAQRLIAAGYAVPVSKKKIERAVQAPPAETR